MKKVNILFISGLIALILLFFGSTSPIVTIRGAAQSLISPFSSRIYQSKNQSSLVLSTILQIKNLSLENNQLKKENAKLKSQVSDLKEIEVQNKALEKEFNLQDKNDAKDLAAALVIGRSPTGQRDVLTISKGKEEGLHTGEAVTSNGYLVGKINQVFPHTSQVELITSPSFITSVILQDTRALGLLKGGINGLVIEQLPSDVEIKNGENVITSAIAGELPEGIAIGQVGKTISKSSDIFKTVEMTSPIDISKLEIVIIVREE
jgi:rod shape-determining protein MreC